MNARLQRLDNWQHGFPLTERPFADIAAALGVSETDVLDAYRHDLEAGTISRIGGVFAAGAGGDSMLAAMAVPASQLDAVAARVSACAGVNHNYAREHEINLWFVMTGPTAAHVEQTLQDLESETGYRILRLRMVRPYRIDLGFALGQAVATQSAKATHASGPEAAHSVPCALAEADWPLAALVEQGLPLISRPYQDWADRLGCSEATVVHTLAQWLRNGQLKRFGVVVRHHELGYADNAMTVFDVPDDSVDACGLALATQAGVTLAYRRTRDRDWPYNLYAMVHGQRREAVLEVIERMTVAAHLSECPRQILFSSVRYKQTGGQRFRQGSQDRQDPHVQVQGEHHVVCE